jgi:hypothetical protein
MTMTFIRRIFSKDSLLGFYNETYSAFDNENVISSDTPRTFNNKIEKE